MTLDEIIREALHSNQYGTLTNLELKGILEIVQFAKNDLAKHEGNRSKYAHDHKIEVIFK